MCRIYFMRYKVLTKRNCNNLSALDKSRSTADHEWVSNSLFMPIAHFDISAKQFTKRDLPRRLYSPCKMSKAESNLR